MASFVDPPTLAKIEAGRHPSELNHPSDDEKDSTEKSITSSDRAEVDSLAHIYEPPDSYESKHRWDPTATWTKEEERKITRRLDWKVTAFACLCFGALQLDRGNINNALSDGFLKDLHLTTNDYNTGQTIFFTSFLAAELPSQLISKKLGSDVWIPMQIMGWSAVAMSQAALKNKAGFYITRCLIGLIEGGFVADTILYLSYYYTETELTIRLSWFWSAYMGTNIIGALLGAGLLELRGTKGLHGWMWLFIIEGAVTFLIGLVAYFYLPASPTQTKTRWRKKGWFTDREEVIIVNKVLRDDPTKSTMHNRQGLDLGDLWRSFKDYDMWPLYVIGLTMFIPVAQVSHYFTLNLRALGFSTFQTNLLTIPYMVLFIIFNLSLAWLARRTNSRLVTASIQPWWHFILLIVLITIPDSTSRWAKWAVLTLFQGYPYAHPILVSLNSGNAGSVRTRTVASSLYNMFVQAAQLIASNIYRDDDKPYYHRGNRVLLGINILSIVLVYLAKLYYVWRNKQKEKVWNTYTKEQKEEYVAANPQRGNKGLDFKFLH